MPDAPEMFFDQGSGSGQLGGYGQNGAAHRGAEVRAVLPCQSGMRRPQGDPMGWTRIHWQSSIFIQTNTVRFLRQHILKNLQSKKSDETIETFENGNDVEQECPITEEEINAMIDVLDVNAFEIRHDYILIT